MEVRDDVLFSSRNWEAYDQSLSLSRGFGQDYAQNKMKDLSDRADIGFCDMNFNQCRGRDVAMDMSVVGFVLNFLNKKVMDF